VKKYDAGCASRALASEAYSLTQKCTKIKTAHQVHIWQAQCVRRKYISIFPKVKKYVFKENADYFFIVRSIVADWSSFVSV